MPLPDKSAIPTGVGLGLRWAFLDDVLERGAPPSVELFEVSPENYMRRGGFFPEALDKVAAGHRVITHGLMMNVGSTADPDEAYLDELRAFLRRMGAPYHSDHLCWTGTSGQTLHDLLPLPLTAEVAAHCARRIRRISDHIGVPFAIENISYYMAPGGAMPEAGFLSEVLEQADCGLMLDVNNVLVNATNHGFDAYEYVRSLPLHRVIQMHVAGGERNPDLDNLVIDTHGTDVSPEVEDLMAWVVERVGPIPVVYERDHNIPPLSELGRQVEVLGARYRDALSRHEARAAGPSFDPPGARGTAIVSHGQVEHGLSRMILEPDPEPLRTDPKGWFQDRGLDPRDADVLTNIGPDRLLVYRQLVRGGMVRTVRNFIPRTIARLGDDRFESAWTAFLAEEGPRSKYLRDVPVEFVAFASPRWLADPAVPDYLVDLAQHEMVDAQIEAAPRSPPPPELGRELALHRPVVFDPTATLVRYAHPVHTLPADLDDRTEPPGETTPLLVYRDREHEVRYIRLSPLAHAVVDRLLHHRAPVQQAIAEGAAAVTEPLTDEVLARLSAVLTDLAERDVMLGVG